MPGRGGVPLRARRRPHGRAAERRQRARVARREREVLMRAAVVLVLVASCGFDRPKDVCDGPCGFYAVDHPIGYKDQEIWFEGTFLDDMAVQFPGAAQPQTL